MRDKRGAAVSAVASAGAANTASAACGAIVSPNRDVKLARSLRSMTES